MLSGLSLAKDIQGLGKLVLNIQEWIFLCDTEYLTSKEIEFHDLKTGL